MNKITDILEMYRSNKEEIKSFDKVLEIAQNLDRNVWLGEVDDETGAAIDMIIRFWNNVDDEENIPVDARQPIKIFIDSPGGSLISTFTMIDAIKLSKTPVWTVAVGAVYSAGFFTFICGHKRLAYPHSSFLFHEGSAGKEGIANQFMNFADFYRLQLDQLKEIVLTNTFITEQEYKDIQKDDYWMSAQKAFELGCIDEIIGG